MESMILATKSGTPIIGQIAVVMGWIMNAIYKVLEAVGIQNLRPLYYYFQYSDLPLYDSSADQTAEILQAECDHAA